MLSLIKLLSFAAGVSRAVADPEPQVPLYESSNQRVAIIGAGAAGTSTAFYLAQYAAEIGMRPPHVTIFERSDYVGGRSTVVNAFDDPRYPIELGASIFVNANTILCDAVDAFKLSLTDDRISSSLGIWNGARFAIVIDQCDGWCGYWQNIKVAFKYGIASPLRAQSLVKDYVNRFLRMYKRPHFPFRSLTQAVASLGLSSATDKLGSQLLGYHHVSSAFAGEIVQAATRVNYAQDLDVINGMGTMISLAAEGAMSVKGGNRLIFEHFANSSSELHLNRAVKTISRSGKGLYLLDHDGTNSSSSQGFDHVVIAAPFASAGIDVSTEICDQEDLPVQRDYVDTDVPLSYAYFGVEGASEMPGSILTTSMRSESDKVLHQFPFFSISPVRKVFNAKDGKPETVYKIFSPDPVSDEDLCDLISKPAHDEPITWVHRKHWQSYPYLRPIVDFDEVMLAQGLWYTGGMDNFASTMETNALMGKNVATLIIDDMKRLNRSSIIQDRKAAELTQPPTPESQRLRI